MPRPLRIALAQFDFPVGAVAANAARITELIAHARDHLRADVVVFPELALPGQPPGDLLLQAAFLAACRRELESIAAGVHGIVALLGWPEASGSAVHNAVSILRDGRIAMTHRKREPSCRGAMDEHRYFSAPADPTACCFEVEGTRLAVLLGHELHSPEALAAVAAAGAHLLLVPDAAPFTHEAAAQRAVLLCQRARETGIAMAWLNAVGGQDAWVFDGASRLVDADGTAHPAASAFDEHWLQADFDPATRRLAPIQWPAETDPGRESLAWRAIVRGTRDYLGKYGFQRAWVGLSGGIDSALVLALAAAAIGAGNITAVRLPSRYTGDLSNDLAAEQARALGVELLTLPIEASFSAFLDTLAPSFAGREPDATEENLQSRCRGVLMMALANKFGGLVLTTGNKSELAVGYGTIYGDTCGGYAPLKDLYKTEVFALSRWRNAQGDGERIPPAVIERPPSAELRENQRDEDSLPPYPVLDAILREHLERHQAADGIIAAGFEPDTVRRVLHLVRIAEWKRHQYALGPDLSGHGFGSTRHQPVSNAWRD